MSAHSVADMDLSQPMASAEIDALIAINQQAAMVSTPAANAAVNNVLNDYGFDGDGQTVVIIDSGIAWDHYALGGAYGAGARVVGGWDFAENDANPYDDGPAGFHGTHVAGIVGSRDATFRGVASGVDLVGLRVFDDAGNGSLEWVEQALQWVHEHKDSFVSPITTVNLSLGTNWNSSTVPNWATLEEEFAQLRNDGIFISVAAGNSFQDFNAAGVSYPAASQYVVPVASHDAAGNLSDFSQRNSRVLVAPGESIRSTVPDHIFGGSRTGQFVGASGTSMAAPWVAGASALLREAYEFMGQNDVNQDLLYQTFRDSADQVFDAITGGWYSRINLEAAIASVVVDDHSDQFSTATNLGTLNGGTLVEGTIGTVRDVDTFSFTAGKTGQMKLTFETTHDMQAVVHLASGNVQWSGNTVTFDVVAGQTYKFSVATGDGIGHYRMNAEVTGQASTHWGSVADLKQSAVQVNGQSLYQIQATKNGLMTLSGNSLSGTLSFRVLDSQMREIHAGQLSSSGIRVDFETQSGETLFVELSGSGTANLRMTNLVSLDNGLLSVHGTTGNDRIEIHSGGQWSVEVNGIAYGFSGQQIQNVMVNGRVGNDQLFLTLGDGNHSVQIAGQVVGVQGSSMGLTGFAMESVVVTAGTGQNTLSLTGTDGVDTLGNAGNQHFMTGNGYAFYGINFDAVYADGKGGMDIAQLYGNGGNDQLGVGPSWLNLKSSHATLYATHYEQIRFAGGNGTDTVNLYGTAGNDSFTSGNFTAGAQMGSVNVQASGVERVNASGGGGFDSISYSDTAGNDIFYSGGKNSSITGEGFAGWSGDMENISASASGGYDIAQLTDTAGNDQVSMNHFQTTIQSGTNWTQTSSFDRTNVVASRGGNDVVNMRGSVGSDYLYSSLDATSLMNQWGRLNRAIGFGTVHVDGNGGADFSVLVGSVGVDRLAATGDLIHLARGNNNQLFIAAAGNVSFDGISGADEVLFSEFGAGDELTGSGSMALARLAGRDIEATNFGFLGASTRAGQTSNQDISAVDYLFMLDGQWQRIT